MEQQDTTVLREKNDEAGVAGFLCFQQLFFKLHGLIRKKHEAFSGKGHNSPKFGYYLLIFF